MSICQRKEAHIKNGINHSVHSTQLLRPHWIAENFLLNNNKKKKEEKNDEDENFIYTIIRL